jgi:hypothetical protein
MPGLLDILTGGANQRANQDLSGVMGNIEGLNLPTASDLQLGPLAQYTSTGTLTPAQMEAAQAGPSAYNSENLSAVPMSTMQQVLSQDAALAGSNGMTPQEQAQIAMAEQSVNENTAGQRGAIAQDFAGRGVPQSLIQAALANQSAGQEAEQDYTNALQGQAGAADLAQNARTAEGSLAGTMFAENAGQANTVAAAQNALNAFNANNVQGARAANQSAQQAANTYNTTNAQNIGNQNTQGANERLYQNEVQAPQEAAGLALERTGQEAGVGESQAATNTAQGQQAAGLAGGVLGAGATLGSAAMGAPIAAAEGGEIPQKEIIPATPFVMGGRVPGQARVAGNAPVNDSVPAKLSPGEFVVPRTDMANPKVRAFLAANTHTPAPPAAHPSDVSSLLRAMSELRRGA